MTRDAAPESRRAPVGPPVVGGRTAGAALIPMGVYSPDGLEEDAMELPNDVVEDVRKRLRRAAGQVQAVERMLAEGRECREVVTQLSAATKALEQAGFKIIAAGLTYCIEHPEEAEADGYPLESVERMFMKLAR
jgi:DNA-binding FrmR family transcriptional regulator